ncbi:unnamed protein product [Danaus chrysippus]|uniref:(African queen) hypothetical protein n=1 Tax=Danaus chrysippus TaxID=151541 RepID=A0A8J2QRZ6_9NEOP|nr:unnamed protein product [Danaus chrysippus]
MELVSFAKEALQGAAEHAASYRLGQTVLRYMDRALWVVEKSARWAVPPPLDQDERPQAELIRPLNWVMFLSLLVVLRVTRESISLINLALGKPPLRSADVVSYIQSKRRYLRTLKYSGGRALRCRTSPGAPRSWGERLVQLLQRTMCYRKCGEPQGDSDEVMVVKRSKRIRQEPNPVPSETSMERLIEKMMVDMEDSDESSSYTLTNVTSARSDRSDCTESDQDAHKHTNAHIDEQNNEEISTELHGTPRKRESLDVIRSGLNGNSKEATIDFIQTETGPEIVVQKHKKFANGRAQNNSFAKER